MGVDTKTAAGRRQLRFNSYDDLLADAQMLAKSDVKMVGNWSLGQIFKHLAVAYAGSIDGMHFTVPFYVKIVARVFMKKKFLYGKIPSGFQIPQKHRGHFVAAETTTTEEGWAALQTAVERLKTESHREPHPVFGELSNQEWDNFHLRHAEMHMSFAVPVADAAATDAEVA